LAPAETPLSICRFLGREPVSVAVDAPPGLSPVVVESLFYLLLSQSDPLGRRGLRFNPVATIIARLVATQTCCLG
jgi:ABC-type tungstate transport system substrate-binding protein